MPLSRYQIRNEYSLADPELYKAADKDDPEALLEGVAMAGLVGVLRQLGDLAEFAAEVFHDLHEEVIATSARGHSLMGRVQQLEAEFPLIEKAFLSQTNHSSFFYNAGIDWHPNARMDQNLITQGDLPRFIMDSYEECRGPPRLFLLDKFDIAGAGACLKRYTDPSFFKVESSAIEITNADVQREKRTRKGKQKRGSRWSTGETPEVLPTSHAKLHQLLLEERIENNISDPARRVKLKRRLNGFPFYLKTGRSYMEKFLKSSPEHKLVHEISVPSSPLKLPANNTYERGLDIHDIRSESPDRKLRHGSLSPTPDVEGTLQNLSMDKQNGVKSDNRIYELPKAYHSFKRDNILSNFYGEVGEKEIAVDGESKTEVSLDGYQSDDVASEVDDYVDALATMESEMETDSELRAKSDLHVSSNKRRMSGFHATEAEHQAPSSDSQSMGSSMLSEDGNSLSKKEISSSSYSDTRSISAENIPLEGEVSTEGFLSNEICEDKGTAKPPDEESVNEEIGQVPSAELANDDGGTKAAEIPVYTSDHREQRMSNLTISPSSLAQVDADYIMRDHVMVEEGRNEMLCAHNAPKTELINDTGNVTNLNVSILINSGTSDAPPRAENDFSAKVSAENRDIDGLDDKYLNMDDNFLSGLSEIPWHSRDASSLAGSVKSQHLADLRSEENLSSLSPAYQLVHELSNNNSNVKDDQPESSSEDLPVNRLDNDDPIIISDASDADLNVLADASVNIPNTINIAQEDEMSNNSLDSISQTENAEDDIENEMGNQIDLPVSVIPHTEEESLRWSLPELETYDTVIESDNILSTPDDVILPAADEQSLKRSLPELDNHDTSMEPDHIVSPPDDVILRATEEQSPERSLPELDTHVTAMEFDRIVAVPDDLIPPDAEIVIGVSSPTVSTKDFHSKDLCNSRIADDILPLNPAVDSTENSFDSPIPVSHSEEKYSERSIMESSKDVHSKDLHASGITDGIQPPDSALKSTDSQTGSPIPVLSHLDDESLNLNWLELENHSKGAGPDDTIPDENDKITPAGDIKPIVESPDICNLKKLPDLSKIDDVPQPDSAELGTSYNDEQNLHGLPISENGEEIAEIIPSIDLVERDAVNFMISPDHESLTRNAHLSDADVERDEADTVPVTGFDDNAKDHGLSMSLDLQKLDEESLSNFKKPNPNQMEAEVSVQDSYSKSDVLMELGIPKVASPALASESSDTVHLDHTEPEVLGSVPDSSGQVESSSNIGNAATTSSPLQQSGLGTNAIPSQKSYLTDFTEDISSLPIHHDAEEHESLDRLDKGETRISQNAAEASLELLPQLEQTGSLDHFDQDGCYDTASGSLLVNLPTQQSDSMLLPQDNCSIGDISRPKDPFSSFTAFGLLPEAKINLEDMPPLPPLPPVQWRMGKQQHTTLGQEKEALPSNMPAFPSFSMSMADQKAQPLNPFLPCDDMAGENSHQVYGYTSHNPLSDGPFLLQVAPMVHHENNTNSLPPLGETQSINQLLPPEKFDEMSQDDSYVGETDKVPPSLSSFSQGTSVDAASTHASNLPNDEASQLQHQVTPETSSKDEKLDQGSAPFDGNIIVRANDLIAPKIDNEQPQIVMSSPTGEIAWPSQDDGKANGGRTTKLPRPRNPLIDAVVAHDQSKLRKVAERPRPQIQKADERDSILEQIRAKSFNLKPAVVSRPAIQGPTTNLRVAAILEKAKTIRQAFAGSDEDDDDDSWSDS